MERFKAAYLKVYDSALVFSYNALSMLAPICFYIGLPAALLATLATIAQGAHRDPSLCTWRSPRRELAGGFVGNPDFYGLGIRLGVYMQWLASLIAYASLLRERRSLAAGYAIFSLSFAIA